jgi:hypothetical protein
MPKTKVYKKRTHHFCYSYTQQQIIQENDKLLNLPIHITFAKVNGKLFLYTECTEIKYAAQTNLDFAADHKRRFPDSVYYGTGIIYSINGVKQ